MKATYFYKMYRIEIEIEPDNDYELNEIFGTFKPELKAHDMRYSFSLLSGHSDEGKPFFDSDFTVWFVSNNYDQGRQVFSWGNLFDHEDIVDNENDTLSTKNLARIMYRLEQDIETVCELLNGEKQIVYVHIEIYKQNTCVTEHGTVGLNESNSPVASDSMTGIIFDTYYLSDNDSLLQDVLGNFFDYSELADFDYDFSEVTLNDFYD